MINFFEIKKDITLYREQFDSLKEKILDLLIEHTYRFERYDQEYSAMLVYSDTAKLCAEECGKYVRKSDHVYRLYDNMILVMFDMTNAESSFKAAQNFQFEFMKRDLHQDLYFSLAPIHQVDTAIDIGSRLLILMDYAISEGLVNIIIDMDTMRQR